MAQNAQYEKALISSKQWAWATNPSKWHSKEALRHIVALDSPDEASALKEMPRIPQRLHVSPTPDTLISVPGTLSALPLEIVFQVIDHLDIESAEVFSQTSRMSRYMLQKHPSYKTLLPFALPLRKLHKQCGTEDENNIYALGKEMRNPYCRCCGRHGTKLYLPLGERVCTNCSTFNPAFWCMSIKNVMAVFCLSERQIRELPTLKVKELQWDRTNPLDALEVDREGLIPAKSAFRVAMEVWGNRENMCRYASAFDDEIKDGMVASVNTLIAAYWLLRNIQPKLPDDPTQLDVPDIRMASDIVSTTSVPFPWIPKGKTEVERRYICRGCVWLNQKKAVSDTLLKYSGINPELSDERLRRILKGRCEMTYTWEDLMIHARGCAGAGILMCRYFFERDYQWCLKKKTQS